MKAIKKAGLWISGILFCVEILGDILIRLGSFVLFGKWYLDSAVSLYGQTGLTLLSEFFFIVYLVVGMLFLTQLFNKQTTFNLSSYKWVYSMSVFIFFGILTRYISNDKSIEKILSFEMDSILIFISLTFIFFFQRVYRDVAQEKYSYILFLLLSVLSYLYYLFRMAPIWEYHRVVFW